MKKIILLFWVTVILGIQAYSQEVQNGFFVNPNAFEAKVFLLSQEVEKGLLYKIGQDSVSIASYTNKKSKGNIENLEIISFHANSIELIKTRDPLAIKRGRKKGALIGIIPGALLGVLLIAVDASSDGQVNESLPLVLLFAATTFGLGAGIGTAIGSISEDFHVDYSWAKFQELKMDLDRRAYLTKSQDF